jgi:tetratricopeptide (TPR) repeat protein
VRFDKWTYVIGGAAVAAAVVLGALAGARPGVLTALAGLMSAVLWQTAANHRANMQASSDLLQTAERELAPPHADADSPAMYLRAEAAVVPFQQRPELATLRNWLVSDRQADVALVIGEGGAGKTRLALQLAAEAEGQYGFRCYWVPAGGEQQAAEGARHGETPVLLIADYAETCPGLATLLAVITRNMPGPSMRVLLLARSAGEWWQQLINESAALLSDLLAAISPMVLGALTDPSGQEEVFQLAMAAFADKLDTECPDAGLPPVGPDAVALVVHAAALLAVLDHQSDAADAASVPAGSPAGVIARLLGHEARYWQQSQPRYELALGATLTARVVAAGTLIGADDEASAAQMLARIDDLADPHLRGKAARWLHDLYPPADTGTAAGEWIAPLRPDLIAENLVVRVLAGQPGLTRTLMGDLDGQRATKALTLLARAALAHPAAKGLIDLALISDPGHLAVPAMDVAIETNPSVAGQITDALNAGDWPADLLDRIARALPDTSVALAGPAARVFQRLADKSAGDSEKHGQNLIHLSNWLSRLGRREEALAAIEEALTAYRQLATARPDAFLPDLATSLNNQSVFLAHLGRREEALAAIEEAVTIRRQLAAARPDAFLPHLATSLNNQSGCLYELGRREEALAAIEEAVTAYRQLGDAFVPDLATSLNNQSSHLADLGRREEALAAIEEAVTIRRQLATARPDAFLPDLAGSLNNQSGCLADLGRRKEALVAIEEAVTAYRQIAAARRQVYSARLAASLKYLAAQLEAAGRNPEADTARAEAARLK